MLSRLPEPDTAVLSKDREPDTAAQSRERECGYRCAKQGPGVRIPLYRVSPGGTRMLKKEGILMNRIISGCTAAVLAGMMLFAGTLSVSAREEEPDPYDLSWYMDESIYDAQASFKEAKDPVPARGFSLYMQLGEINEDGFAEASMTAYSETGIVRSVQVHNTDNEFNIFGIHYGTYLYEAVDLLADCHYTLETSQMKDDGSFEDTYNSYMDLYTLYLKTDKETKVTDIVLSKNVK